MKARLTMRWIALLGMVIVARTSAWAGEQDGPSELRTVAIGDGVELNYIERGKGVPVVFVHGTLGDYSVWEGQIGPFAETCRVLAYSRRYNFPNTNALRLNHSAVVEAEDLAAFIEKLNLGKVHVIGHSYGAYAALFLAVKHPELVRRLILAEPPVVFVGEKIDEDKRRALKRTRAAFERGDAEGAVRAIIDSSEEGKYDKIPKPFHTLLLRNAPELKALVMSDDMYPQLDRDSVRNITAPTLLLSGEKSAQSLKRASEELARLLPGKNCKQISIPGAEHGMWLQQPDACRKAVLEFLSGK